MSYSTPPYSSSHSPQNQTQHRVNYHHQQRKQDRPINRSGRQMVAVVNHRRHSEENASYSGDEDESPNTICQLQACNVLLALLGAIGLGLAGTQFQPRIGIDNYRQIDLRLAMSVLYTVTGTVGFYCVGRSHGSIVIKTLYTVSAIFAFGSAIFYGFTTYKVADLHHQLVRFEHQGGMFTSAYGVAQTSADFVPKTVISSAMIGLSLLVVLVALLALALLDRLVVMERYWYPEQPEHRIRAKFARTLLMGAALAKMLTGTASLALAAFVEYQHIQQLALRQDYFRIVLDQLSAILAISSAVGDIYAVYNHNKHETLNLKVCITLSALAALWCLKSIDNNAFPFYKQDINAYRVAFSASQSRLATISSPQYTIVVAHGILLALLSLLALLCASACLLAACCLRESITQYEEPFELSTQNRFLGLFHSFWALCLLCLLVIGHAELPWNGDFIGGDLLWIAILLLGTSILGGGCFSSNSSRPSVILKFVLNMLAMAICAEKALVSIWLIYQSGTHPDYINEAVFDRRSRIGQTILHGIQFFILTSASLTALCGISIYGKAIGKQSLGEKRANREETAIGRCFCYCCAISALLYAIVLTGSEVFFELDKWFWSEVVLEQNQFYRLANGPFALAVFIVQLYYCANSKFLVPAILLQLLLCSLALFTLNLAITNTYYLQVLFNARSAIGFNNATNQRALLITGICFAAASAFVCAFQLISGTICILRGSYRLHHQQNGRPRSGLTTSTTTYYRAGIPIDEGGNIRSSWYGPANAVFDSNQLSSPTVHQIAIQPIEEQTLYWSADDNPYIYKSTKRIFGQPILGVNESGYEGSPSPQDQQPQSSHYIYQTYAGVNDCIGDGGRQQLQSTRHQMASQSAISVAANSGLPRRPLAKR